MTGPRTVVQHSLDDLRSDDVRFLQEAADGGALRVRIPSDALVAEVTGAPPKFPVAERLFLAQSLRWVSAAEVVDQPLSAALDVIAAGGSALAVRAEDHDQSLRAAVEAAGLTIRAISA